MRKDELSSQHSVLFDYYQIIEGIFARGEPLRKMITKIRSANSDEDAMIYYETYRNRIIAYRFAFYSLEEKIRATRKALETLDYFGVEYPPAPELIKR